jgi:hypothetical protein
MPVMNHSAADGVLEQSKRVSLLAGGVQLRRGRRITLKTYGAGKPSIGNSDDWSQDQTGAGFVIGLSPGRSGAGIWEPTP